MYLAKLVIDGFRSIVRLDLQFRPGLNIIVGPNNVGKTAIVDALRALLTTADDGSLRVDELDLHRLSGGAPVAAITFRFVFRGLSEQEEADFLPALKALAPGSGTTEYEAHLSVCYKPTGVGGRYRAKRWCGDHEENLISGEMLDDLRAVYLPPLRDPAFGLRPNRTSQLARLIDRLASEDDKKQLLDLLSGFEAGLSTEAPVARMQTAIAARHNAMLGPILAQSLKVGIAPSDFQRFAARLSLDVGGLDIEQNGLGYNNLIYMAVVLSELALNPDATYKALIIEEPEAHLHPQLQAVLLDHLQSIEKVATGTKPVQVFVTSHSPHFASIANIDSLSCIHNGRGPVQAFLPRDAAFGPNKKEKLQRYLDVTRAELFFAKRIILVEGASERFLVSALAAKNGFNLRQCSASILSAEGLNFDCFAPLFGDTALPVRVAIISDADPQGVYPSISDPLSLSSAASVIGGLKNSFISTFFARKTLEYDLALHLENHPVMISALAELHPKIALALQAEVDAAPTQEKPKVLYCGMFERSAGENVQKGAYSQALALAISTATSQFTVPSYIIDALKFVVAP